MSSIFSTLITEPLYNTLIFLVDFIVSDIGIAVIVLTLIVRAILYPLSKNSIKTQLKMKKIQGPLDEIKKKYKNDPQKSAMEMMKLYKENDIKPLSGFLLLFIQIPIIFGLYHVFLKAGLPEINYDLLYSFTPTPEKINLIFLGIFDITQKSIVLSLIAGIAQFFQAKILMKANRNQKQPEGVMGDVMKSMQIQMKYVMPIIIVTISYSLGSVVALYFATSGIFSVFQEIYIRRQFRHLEQDLEQDLNQIQAPQS